MKEYILYLDESEITEKQGNSYFSIGGVIIEKPSQNDTIAVALETLKKEIWIENQNATQIIIHEKEVSEVHRNGKSKNPDYSIFQGNTSFNKLYNGLSKILKDQNITTMGVCINISELSRLYQGEKNEKLTIAIQMLIENYCHFLIQNDGTGDICYEFVGNLENQRLRQRFYELKALGTMYYTSRCIQTRINNIEFIPKSENKAGLQLADFIPNTLTRMAAKKPPKHNDFKKVVVKNAYNGGLDLPRKYGLKIIP